MIKPIEKLIQISPINPTVTLNLSTADGRFALADQLQKDIDEWCTQAFDDGPRTHLGASIIGGACDRHSWYVWRWVKHKVFSGRMQRLFQDGHWYEERYIQMLEGIGCKVSQVNEDGEQHRIYAVNGHFGGSLDGKMSFPERYGIAGEFLSEFKTSNNKLFASINHLEEDKAQHWGQMCVYAVKRQIRYGVYFVVNKDNADLKVFVVELDWELGQRLIEKGEWIIMSPVPPPKITDNASDYRCKMCDHHGVCHLSVVPDVNCRTCRYSEPIEEKKWRCNRWSAIIPSMDDMLKGCPAYERLI